MSNLEAMYAAYKAGAPRWIPVIERLPEPDIEVLIFVSDDINIGIYAQQPEEPKARGWHEWYGDFWSPCDPTHWQPLPEPPK